MNVQLTTISTYMNLILSMHLQMSSSWFWLRRFAHGWWRTPLSINALQVWISCCNKSIVACEYGNSSIWNNKYSATVRVTKCWTFLSSYIEKNKLIIHSYIQPAISLWMDKRIYIVLHKPCSQSFQEWD